MFDASFVHGAMFLKASLHGLTSPFANTTFMTGSERVHMGSVFAGKMIPEAMLHTKKRGTTSPKKTASMMRFEKLY